MLNEFSQYEDEFQQWVRDGYPNVKPETLDYIQHLSDPEDDSRPRQGTLWEHQWDSFLRVVYAHEIKGDALARPNGVLLNIVTGGGKTAIIAALIVWLRLAHDVQKFLLLCPNLIVRDRLEDDFENGKVFVGRDLIPQGAIVSKDDFALTSLGSDRPGGWASLLGASVILGNIHQFYTSNASGQSNLSALMNGPKFALFNDEAHNSPAPEWDAALDLADRLVKTRTVVYQPSIATVELTYTDARTGETRSVEEIDWAEVDRLGLNATQWVTDDKPMQQQMAIALQRLREQERRAKGRYQPILFVVAVCKLDAQKAAKTLTAYFRVKTLLVTEDSSDEERRQATELGKARRSSVPYKAVVSVLMLREGWDVPEVGVILLLRKFGSRVYGQQVIGRGLRRVRSPSIGEDEQQICAAVDHPKLEHQWLWDIFNSKVRTEVGVDQEFDEKEDLPDPPPRQILVKPSNIIEIPEPSEDDEEEFIIDDITPSPELLRNWREVLEGLMYPTQTVTITNQDITGVERQELTGEGWRTLESAPRTDVGGPLAVAPEDLGEAIKDGLLAMAERLLAHAGHTAQFKGKIYSVLLEHIRVKFLDGYSLGLAEPHHLETTWRVLSEVERQISGRPGLIEGMVKDANK